MLFGVICPDSLFGAGAGIKLLRAGWDLLDGCYRYNLFQCCAIWGGKKGGRYKDYKLYLGLLKLVVMLKSLTVLFLAIGLSNDFHIFVYILLYLYYFLLF